MAENFDNVQAINRILEKDFKPTTVTEIRWQSDNFLFKPDEELDNDHKEIKQIFNRVLEKTQEQKPLKESPPNSFDTQTQKAKFALFLKEEYFSSSEIDVSEILRLLEKPLPGIFKEPENALSGFDVQQVDLLYLLYILRTEQLLKTVDQKFIPMVIKEISTILGFDLKFPIDISYTSILGNSEQAHSLRLRNNKLIHSISLGVHPKDNLLKKLSSSEPLSPREVVERMSMIVHEIIHAFASELIEELPVEQIPKDQRDLYENGLNRIIGEGFSMMAERVFVLRMIAIMEKNDQHDLAEVFRALMAQSRDSERALKKELREKPMMKARYGPYILGLSVMRKLKKYELEEVIQAFRAVSKDKIVFTSSDSLEMQSFVDDPMKWLQNNSIEK